MSFYDCLKPKFLPFCIGAPPRCQGDHEAQAEARKAFCDYLQPSSHRKSIKVVSEVVTKGAYFTYHACQTATRAYADCQSGDISLGLVKNIGSLVTSGRQFVSAIGNYRNESADQESPRSTYNYVNDLNNQYVKDIGGFILREPNEEEQTSHAHLYSVLNAEKIRRYIRENGIENHFVVAEKWIVKNLMENNFNKFCVLAKKIDLSNEIAAVKENTDFLVEIEGQADRYFQPDLHPRRELRVEQVKGLAELAFLGLTYQSYDKLYFDESGRVAILDTEPFHRTFKKQLKALFLSKYLFTYNSSQYIQRSFYATSALKFLCDPQAKAEVEKIETRKFCKTVTQSISRVALCCLALYAGSLLCASAGVPACVLIAMKVIGCFKTVVHIHQTLAVCRTYFHARNGYKGWRKLDTLFKEGKI